MLNLARGGVRLIGSLVRLYMGLRTAKGQANNYQPLRSALQVVALLQVLALMEPVLGLVLLDTAVNILFLGAQLLLLLGADWWPERIFSSTLGGLLNSQRDHLQKLSSMFEQTYNQLGTATMVGIKGQTQRFLLRTAAEIFNPSNSYRHQNSVLTVTTNEQSDSSPNDSHEHRE